MARAIAMTEVGEKGATAYPTPFRAAAAGRFSRRLGHPFGLGKFGVNLVRLAPGTASALRHAHSAEDAFVRFSRVPRRCSSMTARRTWALA
jgi:uncharacterized cupin superfamily protein